MIRNKIPGSLGQFLEPTGVGFSVFTTEEIKKLSAVEIRTSLIFDSIGQPLPAGLYDTVLGPLEDRAEPCGTCKATLQSCTGHLAFIYLPLPVVNPLFHKVVSQIIRLTCIYCYRSQIPGCVQYLVLAQLKLLDSGYPTAAEDTAQHLPHVSLSEEGPDSNNPETIRMLREALDVYCASVLGSGSGTSKKLFTEEGKIVQSLRNSYVNSLTKCSITKSKCQHCKNSLNKFSYSHNKLFMTGFHQETESDGTEGKPVKVKSIVLPDKARDILRNMWLTESDLILAIVPALRHVNIEHPTDQLFLETVPVIPPKVRPVQMVASKLNIHPQTNNYIPIVNNCVLLRHLILLIRGEEETNEGVKVLLSSVAGETPTEKLHSTWQSLQADVDHLMDKELNSSSTASMCTGLKQVIEKKAGCIRMNMMGKRVNFAARSVITPDPNLEVDEIGVPEKFALVLTYPMPVTAWNVAEMRQLILNGPFVHPGAVAVQNEDGTMSKISGTDKVQRETIAKRLLTPGEASNTTTTTTAAGVTTITTTTTTTTTTTKKIDNNNNKNKHGVKIVHRHLHNGDVLLLNRQPTLHRPSIMAHKARILKGEKTLRLNYANCKAYNADFDGDEMNAHFPQSELARSEAYTLVNVCNNYLVPKDGTPLSGLIQDHVVSGVRLTMRGRFFNRDDYHQLTYQALSTQFGDLLLLPPAIMKPKQLWSGKQVISTIILNVIPKGRYPINLNASAKIGFKAWENAIQRPWKAGGTPFMDQKTMSEAEVIIRQGELMCGVLDKTHYGATPFGLVHCLYELYGGTCSSKLLSAFSKLFTSFLQLEGFTLGVEDILVVNDAEDVRTESIVESRQIGDVAAARAFDLEDPAPDVLRTKLQESLGVNKAKWRIAIDRSYKSSLDGYTNVINKACLPAGLLRKFPANNLQLMVQSGAKGSTVNTMQISCLLGQIELEGKRPPLMISGKSLPSFPKFETAPRAGGFIDGRFLTGIQPQEFFFHCMAGREGLIDTAVKTSRSGYLQRCLVKHLEGLTVNYDQTVRDSDGSVVQFYYGEDGLDVTKAQFLTPKQMPFLVDNARAIICKSAKRDDTTSDAIAVQRYKIGEWQRRNGKALRKRCSPFAAFSVRNADALEKEMHRKTAKKTGRSVAARMMCEMWRDADAKTRQSYMRIARGCPDPVMSVFQADRDFGTLSEYMESLMCDYLESSIGPRVGDASAKEDEQRQNDYMDDAAVLFRNIMCHKSVKSLCPAGEPVGLLAAQSIGEPSTQMTLNTFHFAGRGEMNVTLGIPRLREILMVASKTMKTPSMDIPFLSVPSLEAKANHLRKKISRVTLNDVLELVTTTYHLQLDPVRKQVYRVMLHFLPHSMYKDQHYVTPDSVLRFIETGFVGDLVNAIRKMEKAISLVLRSETESSREPRNGNDDDDEEDIDDPERKARNRRRGNVDHEISSDEEASDVDDDATTTRTRARHNDEDEDVDEDEEMPDEQNDIDDGSDSDKAPEIGEQTEGSEKPPGKEDKSKSPTKKRRSKQGTQEEYIERKKNMIDSSYFVLDYDFDPENGLWCSMDLGFSLDLKRLDLSSIIREVAETCIIWETPLIKKAFTYESTDKKQLMLKTDGINIAEMYQHDKLLDLNRLYTNDIHGMADTYGIEAARRVIVKEVQDVFKMYGITVDARHLLLIADYMTFNGKFEPLSRTGMDKNVSPLQQMSFESSLTFLKQATVGAKHDHLRSPSSRVMVGRPCASGTGVFSVIQGFHKPPPDTFPSIKVEKKRRKKHLLAESPVALICSR